MQPAEHPTRTRAAAPVALALALAACSADPKIILNGGSPLDGGLTDARPVTDARESGVPVLGTRCQQLSSGAIAPWTAAYSCRCTPSTFVRVGCNAGCGVGETCSGDPVMGVCRTTPASSCAGAPELQVDDSCGGICPATDGLECPSSGTITVLVRPYRSGESITCNPFINGV